MAKRISAGDKVRMKSGEPRDRFDNDFFDGTGKVTSVLRSRSERPHLRIEWDDGVETEVLEQAVTRKKRFRSA